MTHWKLPIATEWLLMASLGWFILGETADAVDSNDSTQTTPLTAASANAVSRATYNGLIVPDEGVLPNETGYFRLTVSRNRRFTGLLLIGRHRASFKGQFNEHGAAYVPIQVGTGEYNLILN